MKKHYRWILTVFMAVCQTQVQVQAQVPTRWRGPEGNGTYPGKGLLTSWPAGGPEILWSFRELGQGFSSAVVTDKAVYATGMTGEKGYLFKFKPDGSLVYKASYGPEYIESYYGTRGSPVVDGDLVYLVSGNAKIYCLEEKDGLIRWSKDLFRDFDGRKLDWGFNETPVVDGDLVFATPGGVKNNVIALNRFTGALVWSSRGDGEPSAFCTPLLINHNGRKILATHTARHLIGLDAGTGKLLWTQSHTNQWAVHPNTPIYSKGRLYHFSGYGQGGGMLELSHDGSSVSRIWTNKTLDSRLGGAVLVNGYIYGSGDNHREWKCLDWKTGKEMYTSDAIGKGAVICAGGFLICYSERGELALVKADPSGFRVISQTRVSMGSGQHWAHPVIHKGVLYVRHGNALIAYKIGS